MKGSARAVALAFSLFMGFGVASSNVARAQLCEALHAEDYAPVVDKKCGQWMLQRMDHANPKFGPSGWQLDDHGKHFVLVGNYNTSSGSPNFEYFQTIDRALLVDDADLRIGKARPLREDRTDTDLEASAVGLYLEEGYAESIGALAR